MIYYVVALKDGSSDRLNYHTGKQYYQGGEILGSILDAKKYKSWEELINFLATADGCYRMRCIIKEVSDTTLDRIEEDKELYAKFHDPMYVL